MAKILVVDDEVGIRELLQEILRDEGYDVAQAENAASAREARQNFQPDLILLDIWMPDTDGISLLKEWAAGGPLDAPVIMMSGHGSIDTAIEAVRFGALDFLEKPIALQKLLATVKRGLQRQTNKPRQHPLSLSAFRSAALRDLRKRLEQMAQKCRQILLRTGPGSLAELCARSLHASGTPWLDLGNLHQPLDLGTLEDAKGGLLFVEELQRLGRAQQKNLAFALERLERYDLHLLMATTSTPEQLLTEGWEPGLIARLFDISLVSPSLLELKDEVPEIVSRLLIHFSESGETPSRRLGSAALHALRNTPWGGGFGELKAAIRSLALGALNEEISADEVVRFVSRNANAALALPLDLPLREARESFERMYFEHHLQLEDGNITRLAEKTGLERTHLYRKLKQLGIQVGRRQGDA
ncbi:MAG: transcriptional regulator [Candidatus Dactylopiibacterium carminicum]|uniref:Transcriptional regulator n=1 Tax=Candidatus Dactylopiibacterium carminicum TaxID=857335 RepID=A0A272EYX6_9RHOO|nr:response regulator [Candidatus Dactylopiibacterium carminicum]KAF7600828.1 sigma-54-dependent Fis family transcriptional regulator [Candidatus Dactylopiibacterium carminicum]PAS95327.1 MAG: transcriptional regulator [Candidatus Dactylopiibacterium carminicum]PAS98661.1 MAG: transcriptional regulator [Candidatus Dactylopiibacterium carminicum]PAT00833.1 MAG: transcriptional regulator [Candidatus Dactylopiibacterium carminicum]